MCNINTVVAGIAVPAIGKQFSASQTALNLVSLATGLGLSISVLYLGALADRYGRKQFLLAGIAFTIVAGALSSASPSVGALILAQVLVGVAGGMAFPTTLSLITVLWEGGPGRTKVIALWSSISSMASIGGSVLGGLILVVGSWRWVFVLSVPIAAVAFVLVLFFVPSHVSESTDPVDHRGGILSALALGSLVLGISIVFAPEQLAQGLVLLIVAVLLLRTFAWQEKQTRFPLFDPQVAKKRLFWLPAVGGLLAVGSLSGALFIAEQFMQSAMGYNALKAGIAVTPAALSLLLAAPLSARSVGRNGTRTTMLIGYGLLLAALLSMLLWREDSPYVLIGLGFFVIGLGVTFVMTASRRAITSSTPVHRAGMASATSDLQNDLGGAIMQALLGAVLARGFAGAFRIRIAQSPEADKVTAQITHALQSSFASAADVAAKSPQYANDIMVAAKQSLTAGSLLGFSIAVIIVVVGAIAVRVGLPNHEEELAEQ